MTIADSKSITIDMNGHYITSQKNGTVIRLYENSTLHLVSNTGAQGTFEISNYYLPVEGSTSATFQAGGCVMGGEDINDFSNFFNKTIGGIRMDAKSTLYLDNVAVAGNRGINVGGIYMGSNCNLHMSNNASVKLNGGEAGGIWVNKDNCNIYMDNSTIDGNHGTTYGGGIYSNADGTRIYVNNHSSIQNNRGEKGGGVEVTYSYFNIVSDGTGSISNNMAYKGGGGIYVDYKNAATNEGSIENLSITNNTASGDAGYGGGIYLGQRYTTVKNCKIEKNLAEGQGGGIFTNCQQNKLVDCSIRYNRTSGDATDKGAGVYMSRSSNIWLSGATSIADNYTWYNDTSNLFLWESGTDTSKYAYIQGSVSSGSKVVVDTQMSGKVLIGKNIDASTYVPGTIVLSRENHHIADRESNADLYQVQGTDGLVAKVNGKAIGTFSAGDNVTCNGESSDTSKHFWYWDLKSSTGFENVDLSRNLYDQVVTYTMPTNSTDLVAKYIPYVTSGKLEYGAIKAGEDLPTTATFTRTDGQGDTQTTTVKLQWYVYDSNRNTTAVSGKAESGKTYMAKALLENQKEIGLYSTQSSLDKDKVTISVTGQKDDTSAFIEAGANSNGVKIWTPDYQVPKASITSVEEASISVQEGYQKKDILEMLPTTAVVNLSDGTQAVLKTNTASDALNWPSMFDADGKAKKSSYPDYYTMEIGLIDSDAKTAGVDGKSLQLKIYVTDLEKPLQPTVTPIGATYTTDNGAELVGDKIQLTVKAECKTTGATIKYKIGTDGKETVYDPSTGIVLEGDAGEETDLILQVWSEVTGEVGQTKTSPVWSDIYTLDDSANSSLEMIVKCKDTALYADGETHWSSELLVEGKEGESVTFSAPDQENRVFDHWEWKDAPKGTDLNSETLTIAQFSSEHTGEITAVYSPVVNVIKLTAEAPVADMPCSSTAQAVAVGIDGKSANTDITSYLANQMAGGGVGITWSPSIGTDGVEHNTVYTATVSLAPSKTDSSVKYMLDDEAKIMLGTGDAYGDVSDYSYFVENEDGTVSLCVVFPSTGAYVYSTLDKVEDTEVSFADAVKYQTAMEGGFVDWDLPGYVGINFVCNHGPSTVDVTWTKVEGFNSNATGEQELTATGTVNYSSDIDNTGAPETVTAKIKVAAPEKVETPQASVESGTYDKSQLVKLGCKTDDAVIHYTTDGSTPTASSPEYDVDAICVDEDMTIKAIAVKDGMLASDVATFKYKISYKTCEAPTAQPESGLYDCTQRVMLYCETANADIYYTTNPDAKTEDYIKYNDEAIEVTETTTIKAYARANDMNDSDTVSFTYVIYHEQTAKPYVDVEPGEYADTQYVTIKSDTPDAIIRYTTDGSEPSETSPIYDGSPIAVSSSMIIKAIAYSGDGSLDPSDVATFEYTIKSDPSPSPAPAPSGDGSNGNATGAVSSIAATGDATPIVLVALASLIACAAFAFAAVKLRRKE